MSITDLHYCEMLFSLFLQIKVTNMITLFWRKYAMQLYHIGNNK